MPRSLADGHEKIAILTEEPANPDAPTVAELNDGIDAACNILDSDWTFGFVDSEKINERAVCDTNNPNAFGVSNAQAGMTIFRAFDATTKNAHATEDALFQASKVKGTRLWIYARKTAKLSVDAWAADDEIRAGMEVLTDEPQDMKAGYIKQRIPLEPQKTYPNIEAVA